MISPNYSEGRAGIQVVPGEQRLYVFAARGTGILKFCDQKGQAFHLSRFASLYDKNTSGPAASANGSLRLVIKIPAEGFKSRIAPRIF
jgi:hypothetical protein